MVNYKSLSLTGKIASGYVIVILLATIIMTTGTIKLRGTQKGITNLEETQLPVTLMTAKIMEGILQQKYTILTYIYHEDEKLLENFDTTIEGINGEITQLKQMLTDNARLNKAGWPEIVEEILQSYTSFISEANGAISLISSGDTLMLDSSLESLAVSTNTLEESLADFNTLNKNKSIAVAGEAKHLVTATSFIMILGSGVLVVLGLILAFLITKAITKPLNRAIQVIGKICKGDVSEQLAMGKAVN